MCISTLCPDYARKAGIANTATAAKRRRVIQYSSPDIGNMSGTQGRMVKEQGGRASNGGKDYFRTDWWR